jgi:bifunctional non-homologous end joining protein LigD
MLLRTRRTPSGFIYPCLPSPAEHPPSGPGWLHEIKHDGFRMMVRPGRHRRPATHPQRRRLVGSFSADLRNRRRPAGPIVPARRGGGSLRRRRDAGVRPVALQRQDRRVFLYAFDLLELNGQDLRREPIEVRKRQLATLLRAARAGLQLNEHISEPGDVVFRHACKMGLEGIVSKRLGSRYRSGRSNDWLKMKNPNAPAVKREAEEDWGGRG